MVERIEGPIELARAENGGVVLVEAPPTTRVCLATLQSYARDEVRAEGNRLVVAEGQAVYHVTGWDPLGSALVAERRE